MFYSMCSHDTPSRVPLIWRSQNEDHQMGNCKESLNKNQQDHQQSSSSSTPAGGEKHRSNYHQHVPVSLVLAILATYLFLGAIMFSVWEGWSFLDSIYFCFITVSTIGFGDFAPGHAGSKVVSLDASKNEHLHLFACCAYLIFGLVLVAMSFSLVQEEITAKCSQLANSLGLVKH